MTNVHVEVKRWGNSLALIIPAEKARELQLEEGEAVDAEIKKCKRIDAFGILKGAKPFSREKDPHKELW